MQKNFRTAISYKTSGRNFPRSRFFSKRNTPVSITIKVSCTLPKTNSESCQASKMELFAKILKRYILDVPQDSGFASDHFDQKRKITQLITWFNEICLTSLIVLFWKFTLMACNFPLLFSCPKNIRMSTLIAIIITYSSLIIIIIILQKVTIIIVTELCLLNLLILIDCFLCNSYPCVLFESLSHVINHEPHVYSWNLGEIYLVCFLKFWNLPCFTREISKFQKSELGRFIPNLPLKHVITSTINQLWMYKFYMVAKLYKTTNTATL